MQQRNLYYTKEVLFDKGIFIDKIFDIPLPEVSNQLKENLNIDDCKNVLKSGLNQISSKNKIDFTNYLKIKNISEEIQIESDLVLSAFIDFSLGDRGIGIYKSSFIHPLILKSVAVIKKIKLNFWSLDTRNDIVFNRDLNEKYGYNPESCERRIDILLENHDTKFDLLKFHRFDDDPVVDPDGSSVICPQKDQINEIRIEVSKNENGFKFLNAHRNDCIDSISARIGKINFDPKEKKDINSNRVLLNCINQISLQNEDNKIDANLYFGLSNNMARLFFWNRSPSSSFNFGIQGHVGMVFVKNDDQGACKFHHVSLYHPEPKNPEQGNEKLTVPHKIKNKINQIRYNFNLCFLGEQGYIPKSFFSKDEAKLDGEQKRLPDLIIDIDGLDSRKMEAYLTHAKQNIRWRPFGNFCCFFSVRQHNCASLVYKLLRIGGFYSAKYNQKKGEPAYFPLDGSGKHHRFSFFKRCHVDSPGTIALLFICAISMAFVASLYRTGKQEIVDDFKVAGYAGLALLVLTVLFNFLRFFIPSANMPGGLITPSGLQNKLLTALRDHVRGISITMVSEDLNQNTITLIPNP